MDLVQNALKIERHLLAKKQQGLYPLANFAANKPKPTAVIWPVEAQDLRAHCSLLINGSSIEVVEIAGSSFCRSI